MSDDLLSLPRLRALIGVRVAYLGREWVIVEVIDAPPGLVLEGVGSQAVMQADVHGRPWDFGAETRLIPALTPDRTELSEELLALELLDP